MIQRRIATLDYTGLTTSIRGPMRTDAVFKKTFNALLDHLVLQEAETPLDSEARLANVLKVSRTTVRKALAEAERRGLAVREGSRLRTGDRPAGHDYFPSEDTVATSDRVEQKFLEWILRGDRK